MKLDFRLPGQVPGLAVPAHSGHGMGAPHPNGIIAGDMTQRFFEHGLGFIIIRLLERRQRPQPLGLQIADLVTEHALGGVDDDIEPMLTQGRPGLRQSELYGIGRFDAGP